LTDVQQIITDLERQRAAIERAIAALREITGSAAPTAKPPSAGAAKKAARSISPEGKARIAEAQRKRWAAKRKAEAPPVAKSAGASTSRKQARGKKGTKKKAAAKGAAPTATKAAAPIAG
jgi:hypothetical protein